MTDGPGGRKLWRFGLTAVLLLAIGLRTYSAFTEAIERDELFTRDVVSGTLRAGVGLVLYDRYHPPLYYMMAKALSLAGGTRPEQLRLLSVLCGIGLVVAVAFVTRALLDNVPLALLAAALVALSDTQILVSHFARSYALFDLLVLAAAASLWKACEAPADSRFWIGYVAAGVAAVNTSYIGWVYLLGMLPVVAACGARVLKRWFAATAVIALSLLPWTLLLVWFSSTRRGFASRLTDLATNANALPSQWALADAFAWLNGRPGPAVWMVGLTVLVGGALVGRAVTAAVRGWKDARSASRSVGILLLASLAVVPPCALWLLGRPPLSLPLWGIRQLTPSIAPWAIVACAGVSLIGNRARALRVLVAASLLVFQGTATAASTLYGRFVPFHSVARLIAEKPSGSSTVYMLCTPVCGSLLRYYLAAPATLEDLPDTDAALPGSFWLLYRPAEGAERRRFDALMSRGWVLAFARDYERRAGIRFVVRVALLTREGRPRAAAPRVD